MKKKLLLSVLGISATVIITLSSFTLEERGNSCNLQDEIHNHANCQGSHCNGSVGCSCSGFSPITNGDVWQQSYCKRCGHKKSSHK